VNDKITCSLAILLLALIGAIPEAVAQQTGSSTVTAPPPPPPPRIPRKKAPAPPVEEPAPLPAALPASASLDEVLEGKDKTGTPPKPPTEEQLGDPAALPGEDREAPDYDNREDTPVSAGEVLIWIPRAILFPVHLVFEYVIRWPLVNGLAWAEEIHLIQRITEFFTWRDGKSSVYPTFFADFGLKPAVGLTTAHKDFPVDGNDFAASIGWWYPNWVNAQLRNRTTVMSDDSGKVDLTGSFVWRPDSPFYGVGANTSGEVNPPFRFEKREAQGGLAFLAQFSGLSRFKVSSTYRWTDFENDPALKDPLGLDDPQALVDAPGFRDPAHKDGLAQYHLIDSRMELKFDTRDPDTEFAGGSGFLLELFGGFTFSPAETALNFIRWGGEIAGFVDLTGNGHVIGLRLHTELLWRTGTELRQGGNAEIPFTELASLGGVETMRGYLAGRFLGDSTLDATFIYRYPVWSLLDAELFAGVGNAYEGHYGIGDPGENFSFERLYFNAGLGFRTNLERDTGLQILIAFGTNRFDGGDGEGGRGLELDSIRFVFGVAQGF
jgi:hypothetical protein